MAVFVFDVVSGWTRSPVAFLFADRKRQKTAAKERECRQIDRACLKPEAGPHADCAREVPYHTTSAATIHVAPQPTGSCLAKSPFVSGLEVTESALITDIHHFTDPVSTPRPFTAAASPLNIRYPSFPILLSLPDLTVLNQSLFLPFFSLLFVLFLCSVGTGGRQHGKSKAADVLKPPRPQRAFAIDTANQSRHRPCCPSPPSYHSFAARLNTLVFFFLFCRSPWEIIRLLRSLGGLLRSYRNHGWAIMPQIPSRTTSTV